MTGLTQLLETAMTAALEAGHAIMDVYASGNYAATVKEGDQPVTKADRLSHGILTTALQKTGLPVLSEEGSRLPYNERKNWDAFWLIDPLDGTKEFLHQRGEFTVNIALVKQETAVAGVVYAPCLDCLYAGSAETGVFKTDNGVRTVMRGLPQRKSFDELKQMQTITLAVSRSHLSAETLDFSRQFLHPRFLSKGSALKFMLLLEEEADLYPRLGPTMEWDTAAAHAILNASGRGVYRVDLQAELRYNKPDLHNPFFLAF